MNPKISILIPVYNGEATIARAVRSVLEQDYPNLEILVVNDGEIYKDGTPKEVFSNAEMLTAVGLDVPQCTALTQARS